MKTMARKKNLGGIIKSYNSYRLRQQYDNLCETLFHKYFYKNKDIYTEDDFRSVIDSVFEECCRKYNPHRGVDFPGYIKNMLKWGVLSQISKQRAREEIFAEDNTFGMDDELSDNFTSNDKLSILSEDAYMLIKQKHILTDYDKKLIEMVLKGETAESIAEKLKLKSSEVKADMNYLASILVQEV